MRFLPFVSLLFSVLVLSGCALVPESVTLNPQAAPTANANLGKGKVVAVNVIDARNSTVIGGRPSGYGPAADISLQNNITQVVHDSMFDGLKAYGFSPVDASTNAAIPRQLTLRITGLGYNQHMGLLDSNVELSSTIEGTAFNKGRTYDHVYRQDVEEAVFVTPTADQDSAKINSVFSQTIQQIFNDRALYQFLAK